MRTAPFPRCALAPLAAALLLAACAPEAESAADAPPPAPAPAPDLTATQLAEWPALAVRLNATSLADRFVQASALFLGTTYDDGPLGEGAVGGPDPDPRVRFDRVDCVTYLEQSLALAVVSPPLAKSVPMQDPFLAVLDRIRYRDGQVSYANRNHFMSIDWIPANAWLVSDVTDSLAPDATVEVTRTIDRAAFLTAHGVAPRPGVDDARTFATRIIPRDRVASVAPSIRNGELIFWAGKKDGILIVHTGLAVRNADGVLLFRHASSRAGKVTEEPLADYAAHAAFTSGFLVLRVREDAKR
jgi:hypothetical protein